MDARAPDHTRIDIRGLTADSRTVAPGWLFAAIPGARADGRDFIPDALTRGAAAVLAPPDTVLPDGHDAVPLIADPNPRRRLALMAARFYGRQPETVAAVTGTNGKTSVASFTRQIWERQGIAAASMGTLGVAAPDYVKAGSLTTPDPVALHAELAHLAGLGVDHLALEASSHGLDQFRLDGIRFAAAAFTHLSRDHLDYHPDMDAYRAAKLRLFAELLEPGAPAVLNADSPDYGVFADACAARGLRVVPFGEAAGDHGIRLRALSAEPTGLAMAFSLAGADHEVHSPLFGTFQAQNMLCALGLAVATGTDPARAAAALEALEGAPGRMQRVAEAGGATVFVDYAHTPDALETVLRALRPHAQGRLSVLFGAGGDRDPGKRPMMGRAAVEHADIVYVTDDNPRSEDPATIRAAIMAAAPGAIEIQSGRAEAIRTAVAALEPGDLLVLAGKGHEQGQIVGDEVLPFDDAAMAREAAREAGR